jgi:hypothetical protein
MGAPRRSRAAIFAIAAIAVAGVVIAAVVLSGGGSPTAGPTAVAPSAMAPTAPPATMPPATTTPPAGQSAPAGTQASAPAAAPAGSDGAAPAQRADDLAAHATITLRLAIEPAGAVITLDGERVTGPELTVPRDGKQHRMRITAPGYVPDDETVSFDESQRLVVRLERAKVPGRGNPRKDRPSEKSERIDRQSPYAD